MHALLTTLALFTASFMEAPRNTSTFVMRLEPREGVSADLADQITRVLAAEVASRPLTAVLTEADAQAALGLEARQQMLDCNAEGCAAQLAAALNTDEVLLGSLGHLGNNYLLTVTRMEVRDVRVVARAVETVPRDRQELLLAAVKRAVDSVYRVPAFPPAPPVLASAALGAPTPGAPTAPPPAAQGEPAPRRVWPSVVGPLAGAWVPTAAGAVVALLALAVTSPVGVAVAVLVGVLVYARRSDAGSDVPPSSLLAAFAVFPGGWAVAAAAVLGVFGGLHLLTPLVSRVVIRVAGVEPPAATRFLASSAVGLVAGLPGLVLAVAAMGLGMGALLFVTSQVPESPLRMKAISDAMGANVGTVGLVGLVVCAAAPLVAAAAVLVSAGVSLGGAVPWVVGPSRAADAPAG